MYQKWRVSMAASQGEAQSSSLNSPDLITAKGDVSGTCIATRGSVRRLSAA